MKQKLLILPPPIYGQLAVNKAVRTALLTVAVFAMTLFGGQANAQDVSSLTGVAVDDCINGTTTSTTKPTDKSKLIGLYNVGTGKWLSPGGEWGTHGNLSTVMYFMWIEQVSGVYYFHCDMSSGSGTHVAIQNNSLWMDQNGGWTLTKVSLSDAPSDVVYTISSNGSYMTAFPDDVLKAADITSAYSTSDANYLNQVWKIISLEEYEKLYAVSPSDMAAPIDATYLMKGAGFRPNDKEISGWTLAGNNSSSTGKLLFGDSEMYKTYDKRSAGDFSSWTLSTGSSSETDKKNYQTKYGNYFYAYSKGLRDYNVYQDITVSRPGWYLLRCNGFSTTNDETDETKAESPLAFLFICRMDNGSVVESTVSAASLNYVTQTDAEALAAESEGAGIGIAFKDGRYENQVQICLTSAQTGIALDDDGNFVTPVTLRVGWFVQAGSTTVDDGELTAVDEFKLLYAGPRRLPELILDEDYTDLRYITAANDEYKNNVVHLKRTLNAHKWNSLVLPINLTWGQMKRTFGDDVRVAQLDELLPSVVRFLTVQCESDDDVMVKAFTPYIVKPSVMKIYTPSYTTENFYTVNTETEVKYLATDYTEITLGDTSGKEALTKTIPKNNYLITLITLENDKLKQNSIWEEGSQNQWSSKLTDSATGTDGTLTCYGLLAQNYQTDADGTNSLIDKRNTLAGCYIMYKGNMVQVPDDKVYGMKAFRCWFELTDPTGTAKPMSISVDGVTDDATAIEDVQPDNLITSYKRGMDGVYGLNGQQMRQGFSTDGLPKGIYIVNGRKVVVK